MNDFIEEHVKEQDLKLLTTYWIDAKAAEDAAREKRIEIENRILNFQKINPLSDMSIKLPNGVTVSTKINRKWDNGFIQEKWDEIKNFSEGINPFKIVFKEVKRNMELMMWQNRLLYDELQKGVTLSAAKPGFKLKKKGEEK